MSTNRTYQVVVWGSTGFVGRYISEYIFRTYRGKVKFALAARNKSRLEDFRRELSNIHPSAQELPLLTADVRDQQSLRDIASQTTVILSAAGPFAVLGPPVVEACVAERTHYCDLTGELHFARGTIKQHHEAALHNGTKIVHFCGYDSVPSDIGTLWMVDHIKTQLGRPTKSVHSFASDKTRGGFSGGTLGSLIGTIEQPSESVRASADPYCLDPPGSSKGPDQGDTILSYWAPQAGMYAAPFVMAPVNTRVVRRSNALKGSSYGDGFSYQESFGARNIAVAALLTSVYALGFAVVQLSFVRNLIKRTGGPARETCEKGYWEFDIFGTTQEAKGQPSTIVHGRIKGVNDPGYIGTARIISEAAICLATQGAESEAEGCMKGGVLTPATSMGLALLRRLQNAGIRFEIVPSSDKAHAH